MLYQASQKDDYLAGYVMSVVLDSGDLIMNQRWLPIADCKTADCTALSLYCLRRSAGLGCLEAAYILGSYYSRMGLVEEGMRLLTRAAEGGCFAAFQDLVRHCRSIGSDACYVDMGAFLSHAMRLACDKNDFVTAGYLADYLVDDERGALVDRVAALRFQRKSFRMEAVKHTYVMLGDRRWERTDEVVWGTWLLFLGHDSVLNSEHCHFPIVHTCHRLQAH